MKRLLAALFFVVFSTGAYAQGFNPAPPNGNNGGFAAGRYYLPGTNGSLANTGTISAVADTLYVGPFFAVYEPILWTRMAVAITVAGAAGKLGRLGIYNVRNGVPSSLVLDAGTIPIDSTGVIEATISQVLPPGTYATAFVANDAVTMRSLGNNANMVNVVGYPTLAATNDAAGMSRTAAYSFAALPATFGAVTYTTSGGPMIALRTGI